MQGYLWFLESQKLEADPCANKLLFCGRNSQCRFGGQTLSPNLFLKPSSLLKLIVSAGPGEPWTNPQLICSRPRFPMMHWALLSSSICKHFYLFFPVFNSIFSLCWSFAAPSFSTGPPTSGAVEFGSAVACSTPAATIQPLSGISSTTVTLYFCSVLVYYCFYWSYFSPSV